MRNWILCATGLFLVVLAGCATTPNYQNEEDRYTNERFSFSAYIPAGWELYDELPEDIQQKAGIRFPQDFEGPFFFNDSTDGVIAFGGEKNDWSWREFDDMTDSFRYKVASLFVDAIFKGVTFPVSEHNRYEESLDTTRNNWLRNERSFKPEKMGDFTYKTKATSGYDYIYGEVIIYPCVADQSCTLVLMLGSKIGRQYEDMESFKAFTSSIRAHDKGLF